MMVIANYAGNAEAAKAFEAETGAKAYRWDVGDHQACLDGCERKWRLKLDRSTWWSTMPASPRDGGAAQDEFRRCGTR
jgi:hypothetical protein